MKLIATIPLRFGLQTYAEGEEFEVPDKFGEALVAAGNASEASEAKDKPAKKPVAKKAEPEPEPVEEDPKKTYRTRQLKAEK